MQPGRMIHRLDLQTLTLAAADTSGQQAETWVTLRVGVPAEVRYLGGNEAFRAKSVNPEASAIVMLRYDPDVTQAVRFKFGGKYLYPLSVMPDARNVWLTCMCREQL